MTTPIKDINNTYYNKYSEKLIYFRFRIIHINTVVIMYNSKPKFAVEDYTLLNYDKPLRFLNL